MNALESSDEVLVAAEKMFRESALCETLPNSSTQPSHMVAQQILNEITIKVGETCCVVEKQDFSFHWRILEILLTKVPNKHLVFERYLQYHPNNEQAMLRYAISLSRSQFGANI